MWGEDCSASKVDIVYICGCGLTLYKKDVVRLVVIGWVVMFVVVSKSVH